MLIGKKTIGTVAFLGGMEFIHRRFAWSLLQMSQFNNEYVCKPGEIVHYDHATVSYHSYARNSLIERIHGDWLLMLDTDHSFEPDLLSRMLRLMDAYEIDVLTGLYQYTSPPYSPVLYWHDDPDEGYDGIGDWEEGMEIIQVKSAGGGCLLVRKSVYERIQAELNEAPFDIIHPFSEDHSFFRRLEKLDIKAYFAPEIHYPHLQTREVTLDDFDRNLPLKRHETLAGGKR